MDISVLAAIAAGAGVIGVMAWLTLPRAEDYFELSMAELAELTTASGDSPQRPGRAACANTVSHHQPDSGGRDVVECETSPPPIPGSDRVLLCGSATDGAANTPPGGPVFSLIDACGVSAPVVRGRWPRPVLFRVK